MLRRGRGGGLRSRKKVKEDVNPMNYISNLVDAMLVLAVGMMLALVVSWNLQISSNGKIETNGQSVNKEDALSTFTEEDMNAADKKDITDESKLVEKGTVYYEEETNTYYIIGADGTKQSLK